MRYLVSEKYNTHLMQQNTPREYRLHVWVFYYSDDTVETVTQRELTSL